ncbi:MAG TPA: hypothetical protein VGL19_03035 [Polyangiaceae bacterium]
MALSLSWWAPRAVLLLSLSCGAQSRSARPHDAPASGGASLARSAVPAIVPPFAPPAAVPSALPAVRADLLELDVSQVLNIAVTSIALGEGSRVAVLADPPQVGDARGLHALPIPIGLRAKPGEVDEARIYFGRDNEPRIMGRRLAPDGERPIYWRHFPSGWRDGREEIGQLGSARQGGLWGVLGGADPELVCRVNASCIIKRSSGWTNAPAGASARYVVLQGGVLWGLDSSGIAGIDASGWSLTIPAPAWSAPRAFWATRAEAWVSTEHELFHFHDGAWSKLASPLGSVTAWWGTGPSSVWLVGQAGVAHFDGRGFRSTPMPGTLSAVNGRDDWDVWLAGDAGLFHVRLQAP